MDNVQSVHGLSGHCPWTLSSLPGVSRVSMDNVQTVHWVYGQCPLSPWTMFIECMDIVQSGWSHWTLSMDQFTGLCPEYPWTLSRLSTESMVNVHWVHGQCPGSPLSPWTFYRREGKAMDFSETIVVYDLKLATGDQSDKKFLLTSKLCPLGAVCPLPMGYIHVLNHEKKCIKSDLKEISLKLATNG